MDWQQQVFELIDMHSFSNMWFWIALAVMWSTATHWVLGVPYDLVQRAQRKGGQAGTDLQDIVRVNVGRITYIVSTSGLWLLAFACFALTALVIIGFFYGVEICQALFLMLAPMSLLAAINARVAFRLDGRAQSAEDLVRLIRRMRIVSQFIGLVSIFVTCMYGVWYLQTQGGVLGG